MKNDHLSTQKRINILYDHLNSTYRGCKRAQVIQNHLMPKMDSEQIRQKKQLKEFDIINATLRSKLNLEFHLNQSWILPQNVIDSCCQFIVDSITLIDILMANYKNQIIEKYALILKNKLNHISRLINSIRVYADFYNNFPLLKILCFEAISNVASIISFHQKIIQSPQLLPEYIKKLEAFFHAAKIKRLEMPREEQRAPSKFIKSKI